MTKSYTLRLYVTHHLQEVVNQYHDDNGHMGVKIFAGISQYYWPKLSLGALKLFPLVLQSNKVSSEDKKSVAYRSGCIKSGTRDE